MVVFGDDLFKVEGFVGLNFVEEELAGFVDVGSFLAVKLDLEVGLMSPFANGFLSVDFDVADAEVAAGTFGLAGGLVRAEAGLEVVVEGLVALRKKINNMSNL